MRVIREIARGGFGFVSEVELADGRRVARKCFDPAAPIIALLGLDVLKARFKREVKIQRQLSGDFFIPVLSSDLDCDPPSFTMPLAAKNYTEQIAEDRRSGQPSIVPLADILNGLEELHRLDYRHRDLKPQNILFHDGIWKLADFGLALSPGQASTTLTRTHEIFGTEQYMSPEQATAFHTVLPATDIYAFGCILHDLVGTPPRTPYFQCSASGPLGQIIEKCTHREVGKRFQNIATLRAALLHVLNQGVQLPQDASTMEWENELKTLEAWDEAKVKNLLRYFHGRKDYELLKAFDEECFDKLFLLDKDIWNEIALIYCDWAGAYGFDFAYCDVIIGRLGRIFTLGSTAMKATAAVAAARLGADHNRWYVMRRLLNMCGPNLDATVAERLGIDIIAEDVKDKFIACARQVKQTVEVYHPLIRKVLAKAADPNHDEFTYSSTT
jgi:serine/threonine protein kinase